MVKCEPTAVFFCYDEGGKHLGFSLLPSIKYLRTQARLAELSYRATDKPNPGKDLILAATLLSGIIDVSL